jgi:hypothetical protein
VRYASIFTMRENHDIWSTTMKHTPSKRIDQAPMVPTYNAHPRIDKNVAK